ncbi:anti-sigma factor [Streptomyces sp. NBC_01298]|uniref:anti-sigma factor n=1 Tax=Streptomyces sp. NBC_01298 TaxID=2903817 RepID=UPI002E0E134D|nr:anti-sigma factor [Streptomyces sp. NBC_01298]
MKHDELLHTLTGAYALDALTGEDHRAFTTHLRHCEACAQEVGEFAATAARLAVAASRPAPAAMRQTVLRHIDTVRQMPPRTHPLAPVRLATLLTRKAGPFVIAASIASVAAFGGLAAWQHQQTEQARTQVQQATRQAQDVAAVLAAPDAQTVHGRTTTGAATTVITSASRDQAAFISSGLATPPAGHTYQLWFDDHGTMRPAGLLPHDGATVMQGDRAGARAIGLTLEPAGGSPQPTTTALLLLALPT